MKKLVVEDLNEYFDEESQKDYEKTLDSNIKFSDIKWSYDNILIQRRKIIIECDIEKKKKLIEFYKKLLDSNLIKYPESGTKFNIEDRLQNNEDELKDLQYELEELNKEDLSQLHLPK